MNCSDYSTSYVCRTCGSLLSVGFDTSTQHGAGGAISTIDVTTQGAVPILGPNGEFCRVCRAEDQVRRQQGLEPLRGKRQHVGGVEAHIGIPQANVLDSTMGGDLDVVAVPYVLKYLVAELAAMGIKMSFGVSP